MQNRFRPALEALDARDVPAFFTWTGAVDSDAQNPANWWPDGTQVNPLPGGDDTLIFGATYLDANRLPQTYTADCDGLAPSYTTGGRSFAGMELRSGYTGTVTFAHALTVGSYFQAAGATLQPGTDLTVTGTFSWTGGVLNSGTTLANVNLLGATATVASASAADLITANHFNIDANPTTGAGSTATFTDSSLVFTTTGGIEVGALSTTFLTRMLLRAPNGGGDAKPIVVTEKSGGNGTMYIEDSNSPDKPLVVQGGTAYIEGGASKFGGSIGLNIPISVAMSKGALVVRNGATLDTLGKEMRVEGGKLATAAKAVQQGGQPDATIKTKSLVLDGAGIEIVLGDTAYNPQGVNGHQLSKLVVEGDVWWLSGTYKPSVDGTANSTAADKWHVIGKFRVDGSGNRPAKLAPVLLNPPAGGASGREWVVLTSTEVITEAAPPPAKPGFEGAAGVWELVAPANSKEWKVKKV